MTGLTIKVGVFDLLEIIKVQADDDKIKFFMNFKEVSVSGNNYGVCDVYNSDLKTFILKALNKSVFERLYLQFHSGIGSVKLS